MHSIRKWNIFYLGVFPFLSICSSWTFRNRQIELIFCHENGEKHLEQYTRSGDFNLFFELAIIMICLVLFICITCATEKDTKQRKRGKKSELLTYSHKHDTSLNLVATQGACILWNISEGSPEDSRTEYHLDGKSVCWKAALLQDRKTASLISRFLKVSTNKATKVGILPGHFQLRHQFPFCLCKQLFIINFGKVPRQFGFRPRFPKRK